MNASDLYALRERFNQDRTLLCFNGPISRSLIEEIGNALKNYLEIDQARPAEAMDVFSAYIEMTQNIPTTPWRKAMAKPMPRPPWSSRAIRKDAIR